MIPYVLIDKTNNGWNISINELINSQGNEDRDIFNSEAMKNP